MSFTATLFPIIAALIAPEGDLFPRPNRWFTCNTKQDYFYEHILTKRSELAACSDKELQTWVSFNHEFLNHKAHARGFSSINFTPFSEEEFGILSILDVMVHWKEKAAKTTLHVTRHGATASYAAVSMSRHFTCYAVPSYPHPVIRIDTENDDVVYITKAHEPLQDFELVEKVTALQASIDRARVLLLIDSIRFPQVQLDQSVDISWLLNMNCPAAAPWSKQWPHWKIANAMQQTKFTMDDVGAHVQSAAAIRMRCVSCHIPQEIIIDEPFYVWVVRPGCTIPIFAGYITENDWQHDRQMSNRVHRANFRSEPI